MSATNIHIINHTHWDREWFVTSVYTSRWIPGLIDKLAQLVGENPDFQYLFDGQTLVIEDLLTIAPEYAEKMRLLVENGRLLIGPYYCQPDWQLTSGELLVRNLMYGQKDVEKHGGAMDTGWLVDTFGHISQSPQIHQMFGIDSVFVWRGVPQLEPYFTWQAPDGSELLTINLFGGYRNLYGVSHAPEVAHKRLNSEVDKLRPFYPTPDIPLFDGYDLEDSPEDPMQFYTNSGTIRSDIKLLESTPRTFAREIADKNLSLPTISGELNSGKFGATFPGTFSARTYLKVMARDCEYMLFQVCEPLAVMASMKGRAYPAANYEAWGRQLLQNAVHDCICGVSVDQVHEKMDYSYREAFAGMKVDAKASLAAILNDFLPGMYAVNTNAFAVDAWQRVGDELVHVQTNGVGVWPVRESIPVEQVNESITSFEWQNDHFKAVVGADGTVQVDNALFGRFVVSEDHGDTYSNETDEPLGNIQPTSPLVVLERSTRHCVVVFDAAWKTAVSAKLSANVSYATATVHLCFDQSPVIKWQVDLDSRGKNLNIDMVFETRQDGDLYAGMPFDVVKRDVADIDLLPRELDASKKNLLLGQRELNSVTTFPFHDLVAIGDDDQAVVVLAKGVHSYDAQADGTISVTLRRSVEWLTVADLENRIGDAGPFFYVPDARCERTVRHELSVAFVADAPNSMAVQLLNAVYQNPPLVVSATGSGSQTEWQLCHEDLPLASLHVRDGVALARFYNPTEKKRPYSHPYSQMDVWGTVAGFTDAILPKQIQTVELCQIPADVAAGDCETKVVAGPKWRVGENKGLPETAVLDQLNAKIADRTGKIEETEAQLAACEDDTERMRLQHRWYVLKREQVEFQLSHLLNRRKRSEKGKLRYGYLYEPDDEVAAISLELNHLRIKRRIYDYVVESLS